MAGGAVAVVVLVEERGDVEQGVALLLGDGAGVVGAFPGAGVVDGLVLAFVAQAHWRGIRVVRGEERDQVQGRQAQV